MTSHDCAVLCCAGAALCPPNTALLTQQGGCLAFEGTNVLFKHVDMGILKYTDVDAMLRAVLQVGGGRAQGGRHAARGAASEGTGKVEGGGGLRVQAGVGSGMCGGAS